MTSRQTAGGTPAPTTATLNTPPWAKAETPRGRVHPHPPWTAAPPRVRAGPVGLRADHRPASARVQLRTLAEQAAAARRSGAGGAAKGSDGVPAPGQGGRRAQGRGLH